MLKLSKDLTKVKRRIPFRIDASSSGQQDKQMIYVENFPENLSHEHLALIFSRAGKIKHVSIPKYKHSKQSKGFAFIEFDTEEDA